MAESIVSTHSGSHAKATSEGLFFNRVKLGGKEYDIQIILRGEDGQSQNLTNRVAVHTAVRIKEMLEKLQPFSKIDYVKEPESCTRVAEGKIKQLSKGDDITQKISEIYNRLVGTSQTFGMAVLDSGVDMVTEELTTLPVTDKSEENGSSSNLNGASLPVLQPPSPPGVTSPLSATNSSAEPDFRVASLGNSIEKANKNQTEANSKASRSNKSLLDYFLNWIKPRNPAKYFIN